MLTEQFMRDFFRMERAQSARRIISWNRTTPIPTNVNFKEEALTKIREQLTIGDIVFVEENGIIRARLYLG